jgi:amino acid transporter/nucleotide-binding universal stress UspA family protein
MQAGSADDRRTVGLLGAAGVGVGAIVGGGILVLAGVAYATTGPGALVAFAINGLIAFVTAMSFAEVSSRFPQSGGPYTFAKKVLSVRAAFGVGWILWFAYIVAAVLYALGFASYAILGIRGIWSLVGGAPPDWLEGRGAVLAFAIAVVMLYASSLIARNAGGKQYATIGKLVLFAVLIVAGLIALFRQPLAHTGDALEPFFSSGTSGLFVAMGFTFIALQGFDLIAAIGGEVKEPQKNIPKAMFLSLGVAMLVYLPLLFLVAAVGVEHGSNISELSKAQPETVVAVAVEHFMGVAGYWMVVVAAVLSTLSALQANMLAASRVALSMAQDRTLPVVLASIGKKRKTPVMAIYATTLALLAILLMIPDLAAAGAAASLIFLVTFTLTHLTSFLARVRLDDDNGTSYRTPLFPLIPIVGGLACAGLAVMQALAVPAAGGITLLWLGLGSILYVALFSSGAEITDAAAAGLDPTLVKLRGRSPLVLLPIANPAHAIHMVEVANALAPRKVGRVLLLTVVRPDDDDASTLATEETMRRLADSQEVVRKALESSYGQGQAPEALITAASQPWEEIQRVAQHHRCESILLGLDRISPNDEETELEDLVNDVDCDVAIMTAPKGWTLPGANRVLVPVGGRGNEHELRAHLLGSLCRTGSRQVTFVRVLPASTSDIQAASAERAMSHLAEYKLPGAFSVKVLRNDDPATALIEEAENHDLLVLGLRRHRGRRTIGSVALRIARQSPCATIMLSSAPSQTSQITTQLSLLPDRFERLVPLRTVFRDESSDDAGS